MPLSASTLEILNGLNIDSLPAPKAMITRQREIQNMQQQLTNARNLRDAKVRAGDTEAIAQIEWEMKLGIEQLQKYMNGDGTYVPAPEGEPAIPKTYNQKGLADLLADIAAPFILMATPGTPEYTAAQEVAAVEQPIVPDPIVPE